MKKIISVIIFIFISFSVSAKIQLVTSFYPVYLSVINIVDGIQDFEVTNMSNNFFGCLHDYQLTVNNLKVLSSADVFIINGLGMESFLPKVQRPIINASFGIKADNAHVWLSVIMYQKQIANIKNELIKRYPQYKEKIEANTKTYHDKLSSLHKKIQDGLRPYVGSEIITFHESFPYFAKEYNLKVAAVVEREPGTTPSARELKAVINLIKSKKIQAIFTEPQYSSKIADVIAKETKVPVFFLDPIVTGSADKNAYIKLMEQNLQTLQQAFKK